jgi:hypothetical protein
LLKMTSAGMRYALDVPPISLPIETRIPLGFDHTIILRSPPYARSLLRPHLSSFELRRCCAAEPGGIETSGAAVARDAAATSSISFQSQLFRNLVARGNNVVAMLNGLAG